MPSHLVNMTVTTSKKEHTGHDDNILIGKEVPDFTLKCNEGLEHRLSDFRGSKVMLCFYKHSHCPICASSIVKIVGAYKKLAWASKLKVVTVFRTDVNHLNNGLTGGPIMTMNKSCVGECYLFLALADPEGTAASTYHVTVMKWYHKFALKESARLSFMENWFFRGFRYCTKNALREASDYGDFRLPLELLIDEDGILIDKMAAKRVSDSMSTERIAHFLLHGTKLPEIPKEAKTRFWKRKAVA